MRSKAAEIVIPEPADMARREACLADPERFLRTYGAATFYLPFAVHHRAMIDAIYHRAKSGGDKAVAGPRGEGKTQIAVWMVVYVMLAELRRFPVMLAATNDLAAKLFGQVKATFTDCDLLAADFPEVCTPARELEGAPQRAAKQHVAGERTRIVWRSDELVLPHVAGSPYGGAGLKYRGLDAAIRGVHIQGMRPDFAIIDDPETRKVAFSDSLHWDIEELIDGDVALLAGPDKRLSRVILTTVQNRRCYSYRVTDRKQRPSWEGERYRALVEWPTNRPLWDEYIARRQQAQAGGDKDAADALAFYRENHAAMNEGAVMANPERYPRDYDADGNPTVIDALQAFYNQIADYGIARVMAELQNDPEEDIEAVDTELTAGTVQRAVSRFGRNEIPEGARVFGGIDIGKYRSHWVKLAMTGEAEGYIIDYGVAHTSGGVDQTTEQRAIELEVLRTLLDWREEYISEHSPELVFIDSGAYTDGIYEFIRQAQGIPFVAAKGHTGGQMRFDGESKPGQIMYERCRADLQPAVGLWLYNFDSVYWKRQVHDRFRVGATGGENEPGSLRVWSSESKVTHKSYSHHICAEQWEERFIEGKGVIGKWVPKAKQNHWLDATAMALAAAGVAGFRVLPRTTPLPTPSVNTSQRPRLTMPDGRPYLATERRRGR